MTEILIIRGAPGVGKSSIGKLLTQYFRNGVTIEIDEVRRMINSVTWTNTKEHLNAIEATGTLVLSYLKLQYSPVIILDTLSEGTIRIILDKIPTNITCKTISLTATEEKIRERIAKRNEGFMDYEISFKVNSSIIKENLENNFLIDTSELSVEEVFEKIIPMI
jgi:broad-specificity NMP kinase